MDITTIKPTVSQHFDDEIQRFTVFTLISFLLYFKLRKLSKIFLVFVCTFDIEDDKFIHIQKIQTVRVECNEIFRQSNTQTDDNICEFVAIQPNELNSKVFVFYQRKSMKTRKTVNEIEKKT